MENKSKCVVYAPVETYSGYGSRARDVIKAIIDLKKDEWDIKIISCRWGNTPWNFLTDNPEWTWMKEYILEGNLNYQPDYMFWITVPNEFQRIGKYNVGITAGIETTACSGLWLEGCNRMDLVIVPSQHSKDIFENTVYNILNEQHQVTGKLKCTTPVKVLFEGADTDIYRVLDNIGMNNTQIYKDIDDIPEKFAYLNVGTWLPGGMGEDRKNIGLLIKAFYEVFKNKEDAPALILKTNVSGSSYLSRREVLRRINSIKKNIVAEKLPNIYVLSGDISDKEMNILYNHPKVKMMVSLTKGEGFGRPLLEFSLTGKPMLVSGWSGHIDFLSPIYVTYLKGELKDIHPSSVVKDMLIEGSKWFYPDLTDVAYHLSNSFINYKLYTKESKSQKYRSKVSFSWESMKTELKDIMNDFPKIEPVKQIQLKLPKLVKQNVK
jgi:glycosyltransferase involved in cell wall biosynthesis